jgi:transposase InsO family protein
MERDVKEYVLSCDLCQRHKRDYRQEHGLMQPLPTPEGPWEVVGIDFVTGLPPDRKFDAIMVVVDHFSKYARLVPCAKAIGAPATAQLFLDHVFRHHGLPRTVISDRGPQFIAAFWKTLLQELGSGVALSTAFHPETNGLTERVNGIVLEAVRLFCNDFPEHWVKWLPLVEFAYNNAPQTSLGTSPFMVNHGRHARTPLTLVGEQRALWSGTNPLAANRAEEFTRIFKAAATNVQLAKERMAKRADTSRKESPLEVGDKVLLSSKQLKLKGVRFPKLQPVYVGPFTVKEVSNNTVLLDLPGNLHPRVNLNRVKRYIVNKRHPERVNMVPPPTALNDERFELKLDKVLGVRNGGHRGSERQVLVSFKGFGPEWNSWLDSETLNRMYGAHFRRLYKRYVQRKRE